MKVLHEQLLSKGQEARNRQCHKSFKCLTRRLRCGRGRGRRRASHGEGRHELGGVHVQAGHLVVQLVRHDEDQLELRAAGEGSGNPYDSSGRVKATGRNRR